MIAQFGNPQFGGTSFGGGDALLLNYVAGQKIAAVGDRSTHDGTIVASNQEGRAKVGGSEIAVSGALHSCPVPFHGVTSITPITVKTYVNGKLVVTYGAQAGCGAIITPRSRGVAVEN